MISEREFASQFTSFWREVLPNMESVVRSLNLATRTEWRPMVSNNDPARRDLIAETAFETAARRFGGDHRDIDAIIAESEVSSRRALIHLSGDRSGEPLMEPEINEVQRAQDRILNFAISLSENESVLFYPSYAGHGFIGSCNGDISSESRIVEVKYVQRNFRSIDYRQAIVYVSLKYLKSVIKTELIVLLNPFRGTISEVHVDEMLDACGGLTFHEFLSAFSYYVSSGDMSR